MTADNRILSIENLRTHFHTPRGLVRAVEDLSFSVRKGEVIGIVGESGCGKSVTAQSIMRLIPAPQGEIAGGRILFHGQDLAALPMREMAAIRGNRISMIFQEPMTSLNPVKSIGYQIGEMFRRHQGMTRRQSLAHAVEMLEKVQIPEPGKRVRAFPHQLSGGMRQRAMIAMALSCNPEILIADEPTTALDVTVQAQILDLMKRLQQDYHTAILMITHDMGIIADIADQVLVMYAGKAVEQAPTQRIFEAPSHPYTQGLLGSIPVLGARAKGQRQRLKEIKGMVPSLHNLPRGCAFSPRCARAIDICQAQIPPFQAITETHGVRCWHPTHSEGTFS